MKGNYFKRTSNWKLIRKKKVALRGWNFNMEGNSWQNELTLRKPQPDIHESKKKKTFKERLEPQPGEAIEYDTLCNINHRFISWNILRVNMSSKNNVSWSKIGFVQILICCVYRV